MIKNENTGSDKPIKFDFSSIFSAMTGEDAKEYYAQFLKDMMKNHPGGAEKIKNGQFGAMMQVNIQNDGPVTLELEALPSLKDNEKATNSKSVSDDISATDG